MQAIRAACDRVGALLILDEVQTGMARLGEPFGAQLYRVRPDMLTVAKGLGGGIPCGALLMSQEIAADLKAGALGTTFGGGPLACAAMKTVIEVINRDGLSRTSATSARRSARPARRARGRLPGRGFLLGLRTRPRAAAVRDALLARDILAGTSADPHVLRLLPPLILTTDHVRRLAAALEELTDASFQRLGGLLRRGDQLSFALAARLDAKPEPRALEGKVLSLLFLSPSLRTLSSFQAAMMRLGGGVVRDLAGDVDPRPRVTLRHRHGRRRRRARARSRFRSSLPTATRWASARSRNARDLAHDLADTDFKALTA